MQTIFHTVTFTTFDGWQNTIDLFSLLQNKLRVKSALIALVEESRVSVHNVITSALLHTIELSGVSSIAFLDPRRLAISHNDTILLTDFFREPISKELPYCQCKILTTGKTIAWYKRGFIFGFWNTVTGDFIHERTFEPRDIKCIRALDSDHIITCNREGRLTKWNVNTLHSENVSLYHEFERFEAMSVYDSETFFVMNNRRELTVRKKDVFKFLAVIENLRDVKDIDKLDNQRVVVLQSDVDFLDDSETMTLSIWNWKTGEREVTLFSDHCPTNPNNVSWQIVDEILYYSIDKQVLAYDVEQKKTSVVIQAHSELRGFAIGQ
jgi:hypothetical protein